MSSCKEPAQEALPKSALLLLRSSHFCVSSHSPEPGAEQLSVVLWMGGGRVVGGAPPFLPSLTPPHQLSCLLSPAFSFHHRHVVSIVTVDAGQGNRWEKCL